MNIPAKLLIGTGVAVGTGLGSMWAYDHFHGKGEAVFGTGTLLGLGAGAAVAGSAFSEFAKGGTGTLASTGLHWLPAIGAGAAAVGAGIGAMYLWDHLRGDGAARDAHEGERIMAPGPFNGGIDGRPITEMTRGGSEDLHIGDGVYRPGQDRGGIVAEPYTGGGSTVPA